MQGASLSNDVQPLAASKRILKKQQTDLFQNRENLYASNDQQQQKARLTVEKVDKRLNAVRLKLEKKIEQLKFELDCVKDADPS